MGRRIIAYHTYVPHVKTIHWWDELRLHYIPTGTTGYTICEGSGGVCLPVGVVDSVVEVLVRWVWLGRSLVQLLCSPCLQLVACENRVIE